MEGKGIFFWPGTTIIKLDGRKYVGNYLHDYKAGEGTLEWPDGKKLKGLWKMGKIHGIATL